MANSVLLLQDGGHLTFKVASNADNDFLLIETGTGGGGWPGFDPYGRDDGYVYEDGRLRFARHG